MANGGGWTAVLHAWVVTESCMNFIISNENNVSFCFITLNTSVLSTNCFSFLCTILSSIHILH